MMDTVTMIHPQNDKIRSRVSCCSHELVQRNSYIYGHVLVRDPTDFNIWQQLRVMDIKKAELLRSQNITNGEIFLPYFPAVVDHLGIYNFNFVCVNDLVVSTPQVTATHTAAA